jgi:hypothetical protein
MQDLATLAIRSDSQASAAYWSSLSHGNTHTEAQAAYQAAHEDAWAANEAAIAS